MSSRLQTVLLVAAVAVVVALATVSIVANGAQPEHSDVALGTHNPASVSVSGDTRGSSDPGTSQISDATGSTTSTPSATPSPTSTSASSSTVSAVSTSTTTNSGTEKVWVSVVSTTPQTSDDVNTGLTQSAAQTLISQINSYWSTQSGSAVTVQLAGFETRSLGESTCDPNAALSAEETGSFGGMFARSAWKGTHEHLLVLSAESCNADSFATVGGVGGEIFSGNGIGTTMGVPYLLHEFGHNLGFEHADASICTNTTSYDGKTADISFTSTVCPTREYDDYFDIMGYTVKNATPNLSSPQRILAGWMTNYATITSSSATTTTTLTPLGSSGGTQALKVIDPISGDAYYIEYRTNAGLDATSAEFNYGLQCDPAMSGYTICELDSNKTLGDVRVLRVLPIAATGANGTTVLATGLTAGSSDKTKRHTHLNTGDGFSSVDGAFTISVLSMSASKGAAISVTFGAPTSTPTPTPSPTYTTVPATQQLTTAPAHAAPGHRRLF